MADWIERPIHEAIYSILKNVAHLTWGIDQAMLYVINLLDHFRDGLVRQGFTTALDVVANDVTGLSRPLLELALVLFALLLISAPAITLKWVDIRKALLYLVLVPVLLPTVVAGFQDVDRVRGDFGTTVYNEVFARSDSTFTMIPAGERQGMERDILLDGGQVPQFAPRDDERDGIRGVDVAASYLYARRSDVINPPDDLPIAFQERYFPYGVSEFGQTLSADERWAAIDTAAEGIVRTVYGILLVAFAGLETLIDLGFSLTLGFLVIAALLSLLVAWALPFEGIFVGILRKIVDVFLQSWGVATIQALLLSAVVSVAKHGGGIAVLGMGVVGLFIEAMFAMVAWKALLGAVTGAFGGAGAGLSMFDAAKALRPALAPVGGLVGSTLGTLTAAPQAALAYAGAKAQGATSAMAAGYALQALPKLAAMGGLAAAMGGKHDFLAGAAIGQTSQRRGGSLMGATGMAGIGQHVERDQRQVASDQRQAVSEERYQQREAQQAEDRAQREERYQAGEARRVAAEPERAADRAHQLRERERREAERQQKDAQTRREAPIKAIDRGAIAGAVASAYTEGHLRNPNAPPSVDAVTEALSLAPGAFGKATPAVQAVLDDFHRTPLAPDLAERMVSETMQEGEMRPATRVEAQGDLVASGLSEKAASARLTTMQGHMQKLPTSVRVEDAQAAQARANEGSAFAGFSAAHRTPAAEPVVTPYQQPTFGVPPQPDYDRGALPAPAAPPSAPLRPKPIRQARPRHGGRGR